MSSPSEVGADQLPPLPAQGNPETASGGRDAKPSSVRDTVPPTVASVGDALPPLPSGPARETESKLSTEPLPPAAEELPPLPTSGAAVNQNESSSLIMSQTLPPAAATQPTPAVESSLVQGTLPAQTGAPNQRLLALQKRLHQPNRLERTPVVGYCQG